ncbi:MAG: hypothetical protein E6Q76_15725 [Rhizobium sp.]|nr:MAG: hypothetical protein E6Q76_15725 [Rhizobium sp.]
MTDRVVAAQQKEAARERVAAFVEKALQAQGVTFTYATRFGVYFKDEETGEHWQLDLRKPR